MVPTGHRFKFSLGLVAPIVKRTPFADQRKDIFILRGARYKPGMRNSHENRFLIRLPSLSKGHSWFDKPVLSLPKGSPRTVPGVLIFMLRGARCKRAWRIPFEISV